MVLEEEAFALGTVKFLNAMAQVTFSVIGSGHTSAMVRSSASRGRSPMSPPVAAPASSSWRGRISPPSKPWSSRRRRSLLGEDPPPWGDGAGNVGRATSGREGGQ